MNANTVAPGTVLKNVHDGHLVTVISKVSKRLEDYLGLERWYIIHHGGPAGAPADPAQLTVSSIARNFKPICGTHVDE